MKYWVYKDSRILGPFDKNAVAGLPGLDASTLVCAGEAAAAAEGDWRPAGDVDDLAALTLDRGAAWPDDGPYSTLSLLDKLQIDAVGLIGDDEFPEAAENLFQDAEMKKTFGDLLSRPSVDEAELRRAKDRAAELTAQLELLHARVAELEAGQSNLARLLAEKNTQLLAEKKPQLREPAETASVPAPAAPAETAPAPVNSVPTAAEPPVPAPEALPDELPPIPQLAPATPAAPPKKALFERKTFKIVPTVKAFRIVGAEGDLAAAAPAPQAAVAPVVLEAPAPIAPAVPVPPAPVEAAPSPAATTFDWGAATTVSPPAPETASPPPTPISFPRELASAPMPSFLNTGFSDEVRKEKSFSPLPEAASQGVDDMAGAPSTEDAIARLAKPAPAPAAEAPRAPRSNRLFLIAAGALVIVMAAVGALFLRHPKDLKQMTELDDGRARMGAEDDVSRPPAVMVKPKMAAPPADVPGTIVPKLPAAGSAPAGEAPQAASSAKLDAAVAAVKDFPLDGERGTVAQWLQFSYSASPDAGKESWSASETADKDYLVEYRFTPSGRGEEVHYLFEVDMDRGFVTGKNIDAKSVLAGGPRATAEKTKPKTKPRPRPRKSAKRAAKRAADDVAPKTVPLLPLPKEGALRTPAEDDGAFTSDTVNSGL